jgi:Methyltransferase domain
MMTKFIPTPMDLLNFPFAQQDFFEVMNVAANLTTCKSYLEIGVCFGQTTKLLARSFIPGARIRLIDLGEIEDGRNGKLDLKPHLNKVVGELRRKGFDVELKIGDSSDPEVVEWARSSGPYDGIFIDGDHTYAGVLADWVNYGDMGKLIFFHDIISFEHGVTKFWNEIKELTKKTHATTEFSRPMGIGVIHKI